MKPGGSIGPQASGARCLRRVSAFTEVVRAHSHAEARALVASSPTRVAVVHRGVPRSVVFLCPCGCGDIVVINVDGAAGPAWRIRLRGKRLSLLPSISRSSGCRSHFVIWENQVWWCTPRVEGQNEIQLPRDTLAALREEWHRIRTARNSEG